MNRGMRIALSVVALVLVAGAAFYGGMAYGKGQTGTAAFAQGGLRQGMPSAGGYGFPQGGQGQRAAGQGGMLVGTIDSISDGMLTMTDNNGKQTQVKVSDTTLIQKQASVALTDLAQGETVMVSGSTGSDGVVTARAVQVAPAGRFGGQPGTDGQNGPPQDPNAAGANPPASDQAAGNGTSK